MIDPHTDDMTTVQTSRNEDADPPEPPIAPLDLGLADSVLMTTAPGNVTGVETLVAFDVTRGGPDLGSPGPNALNIEAEFVTQALRIGTVKDRLVPGRYALVRLETDGGRDGTEAAPAGEINNEDLYPDKG